MYVWCNINSYVNRKKKRKKEAEKRRKRRIEKEVEKEGHALLKKGPFISLLSVLQLGFVFTSSG